MQFNMQFGDIDEGFARGVAEFSSDKFVELEKKINCNLTDSRDWLYRYIHREHPDADEHDLQRYYGDMADHYLYLAILSEVRGDTVDKENNLRIARTFQKLAFPSRFKGRVLKLGSSYDIENPGDFIDSLRADCFDVTNVGETGSGDAQYLIYDMKRRWLRLVGAMEQHFLNVYKENSRLDGFAREYIT